MTNNLKSMLCLSTVHVRPDTLHRLQTGDFDWLISYRKENPGDPEEVYGAFVNAFDISPIREDIEISDIPEDLLTVLKYAEKLGAAWIMFDCDEEECSELPQYRDAWENYM